MSKPTGALVSPASLDEANEIATLHVNIWRETYRGIAPQAVFEKLDVKLRLQVWQSYLEVPKPRQHTLVAVNNETIVGFTCFGPPTHPVFEARGEVKHLYVDQACKRQGIGRGLMRAAIRQMADDGFESIGLAVTLGNNNALAFYKSTGGVEVDHFIFQLMEQNHRLPAGLL